METALDLAVRNGTVVTTEGSMRLDVGIKQGRIVQLDGPMHAVRELDATGCLVLPGGIDMHVHLTARAGFDSAGEKGFVDDFYTGSLAAIAGGITTIGPMAFPEREGETLRQAAERDLSAAGTQAAVDYVVHPGFLTTDANTLVDIATLAQQGHRSVKTATIGFDLGPGDLVRAIAVAGSLGLLTMIHCEDQALIDYATNALLDDGHGALEFYPQSRPDITELAAVDRAIAICEITGAPIYLVHLSSARALESARRAKDRGLPVFVETRPIYLHLDDAVHQQTDGGRFIGMPPVRTSADMAALWAGIAEGSVHTVGSDHAPWSLPDKVDPALDVATSRKGVADLETMLPMLYSEGVVPGRISIQQFLAVTATNPARLFGLYPRKGTIAVGSDADLLVLDPAENRIVDGSTMQSRSGYSVYDGRRITGWPRFTVSGGDVVLDPDGLHAEPGRGHRLEQGPISTW